MRQQHNRFKDAPWYPLIPTYILVGGAGGIGSWVSLLLARAGFSPVVYDFDILEEHNLGGQLFPKRLVGRTKVEALHNVIKDFSDDEILYYNEKMDANTPVSSFTVSAFDNMLARKQLFTSWREIFGSDPNSIFIDGRLNAEQMQILCIRGADIKSQGEYATDYLFEDSAVEDAPCTMKQTSHAAAMIASHMVGFFTNHFTNINEGETIRSVPFYWEYFIPMDLLEAKQ